MNERRNKDEKRAEKVKGGEVREVRSQGVTQSARTINATKVVASAFLELY